MGRQKPGHALAWRAGVAKQDRVVVGSPAVKNPQPHCVQNDTPQHGVSENPPECTAVRACTVPCSTRAAPVRHPDVWPAQNGAWILPVPLGSTRDGGVVRSAHSPQSTASALKKRVLSSLSVPRSSCHHSPAAIQCCCLPGCLSAPWCLLAR